MCYRFPSMMGGRNARGYHRAPPQVLDLLLVALTLSHLPACSSRPSEALVTHEALIDAIDRSPLSDVSVHVGDAEVELFAYSKGQEAPARNETIFIASASKWVTGEHAHPRLRETVMVGVCCLLVFPFEI